MIITVDDFGYNHEANQLILKAIEKGAIDQASTMVNMVGSKEAIDHIAMSLREAERREIPRLKIRNPKSEIRNRLQIPNSKFQITRFGLHLNLTEGKPLCDPKTIPSLVDKNGNFFGWPGLIKRAVFGQLRSHEIERETRVQIEKFQTVIKPIPFLNSHHHIHLWPSIAKIVIPLCQEYGITHIRWPRKIWWPSIFTKHGLKGLLVQSMPKLSTVDRGLWSSNYFIDLDWVGHNDVNQIFQSLPPNLEIGCHPLAHHTHHSTLQLLLNQTHD